MNKPKHGPFFDGVILDAFFRRTYNILYNVPYYA